MSPKPENKIKMKIASYLKMENLDVHENRAKNDCVLPHGGHQKCAVKMCTSLNHYTQGIPWKGKA